jgi:hypothetical protein
VEGMIGLSRLAKDFVVVALLSRVDFYPA